MRTIWVFGFNGTLSESGGDRTKTWLNPACREMLTLLAREPSTVTAVLSTRALDDLVSRMPVTELILGGGSGAEWRLRDGNYMTLSGTPKERFIEAREKLLPKIGHLMASLPGIELEDKRWSISFHTGRADARTRKRFESCLKVFQDTWDIGILQGTDVVEIQFLPELNKRLGIEILCRFLKWDPSCEELIFAGHDENDALAMQWVAERGGTVFTVGTASQMKGSYVVPNSYALAQKVRSWLSDKQQMVSCGKIWDGKSKWSIDRLYRGIGAEAEMRCA